MSNEMKTAAQHNAEFSGHADARTILQAPTTAALSARKESREALEKRVVELTTERDALKGLVRDLRDAASAEPAEATLRVCDPTNKAILLPGGTRIVLRHIESYAPGGDEGILFKMSAGVMEHWSAPKASSLPGAEARRHDQQTEALAALDKLFAVEG